MLVHRNTNISSREQKHVFSLLELMHAMDYVCMSAPQMPLSYANITYRLAFNHWEFFWKVKYMVCLSIWTKFPSSHTENKSARFRATFYLGSRMWFALKIALRLKLYRYIRYKGPITYATFFLKMKDMYKRCTLDGTTPKSSWKYNVHIDIYIYFLEGIAVLKMIWVYI